MFGKKKGKEVKSFNRKFDAYTYRLAKKCVETDTEVQRALIARFVGDLEYQPDETVKKAIAKSRSAAELRRADNARIEAELRHKVWERIISSPELTDRWVAAELNRLVGANINTGQLIRQPRRNKVEQQSPVSQVLDQVKTMTAADARRQQGNGSGAGEPGTALPSARGKGLWGIAGQLKAARLAGGAKSGEAPAAAGEQPTVAADAGERIESETENHRLAADKQTNTANESPVSPAAAPAPSVSADGGPAPGLTAAAESEKGDKGDARP